MVAAGVVGPGMVSDMVDPMPAVMPGRPGRSGITRDDDVVLFIIVIAIIIRAGSAVAFRMAFFQPTAQALQALARVRPAVIIGLRDNQSRCRFRLAIPRAGADHAPGEYCCDADLS